MTSSDLLRCLCSFLEESTKDLLMPVALQKEDVKAGKTVALIGAYFNPVHSHRDVVEKGIENFKANLRISHYFDGVPYVGSETGSYNDSPIFELSPVSQPSRVTRLSL